MRRLSSASAVALLAPWLFLLSTSGAHAEVVVEPVPSVLETEPVQTTGDSADDPAIWVHPTDPSQSLVLVNNKRGALLSYDLQGQLVQRVTDNRNFWGNVDVRQGVTIDGQVLDLVAASHRRVKLFTVDPETRQLVSITEGDTIGLWGEGLCLYESAVDAAVHVVHITRSGRLRQHRIEDSDGNGLLEGVLVRDLDVGSEAEGCVADDDAGDLYVSEEDVALWRYDAEPSGGAARTMVDQVDSAGGNLAPDIEGLTIADAGASGTFLMASSQNVADPDASWVAVYRLGGETPTWDHAFRVVDGATSDDCDRTDGIAAYAGDLGPVFPHGLFVCQDNNNDAPGSVGNQNLKLVGLESVIDLDLPNQAPVAVWEASCVDLVCSLDGSGSSDPEGAPLSFVWSVDGVPLVEESAVVEHTFPAEGDYLVGLRVADPEGAEDEASEVLQVAIEPEPPAQQVEFVDTASSLNRNSIRTTVTIPASVQEGDALLLVRSAGGTVVPDGPGPEWTHVRTVVDGTHATILWTKVAEAGEAGATVTTTTGSYMRNVLVVAAYRGTGTDAIAALDAATQPGRSAEQVSPEIANDGEGRWRASLWSTKSSNVTSLSVPPGETVRVQSNGSGSGRVNLLLTDSAGPVPAGEPQGGLSSFSDTAVTKTTAWTVLLTP